MRVIAIGLAALLALGVGARASQCYRRVVEPAQYRTVAERALASPERVSAVTRSVEESVAVRPERGEVGETVEVSPPHSEWRTRWEDGEAIGCWVRVPARYAARIRRALRTPARVITQTLPQQRARRTPARGRWAPIESYAH